MHHFFSDGIIDQNPIISPLIYHISIVSFFHFLHIKQKGKTICIKKKYVAAQLMN